MPNNFDHDELLISNNHFCVRPIVNKNSLLIFKNKLWLPGDIQVCVGFFLYLEEIIKGPVDEIEHHKREWKHNTADAVN